MAVKYRVYYTESERGWGQDHWTTDYDSYDEAAAMITKLNADNKAEYARTKMIPDCYILCKDTIEVVEV